jgi:hypothetical protein
MGWMKLSGAAINSSLRDAVEQAILDELNAGYTIKVCIGTDSQVHGNMIEFALFVSGYYPATCFLIKLSALPLWNHSICCSL